MALRDDEYVLLKNKRHPLYKGVLREAHENGLLELTVKLVESPSEANGQTAIVEATAIFPGPDGRERIFTELGDANKDNTTAMIAVHKIRLAATRAKGRALRDALGIGEALVEEMHDMNGHAASYGAAPAEGAKDAPVDRPRNGTERAQGNGEVVGCESCGAILTASQAVYSRNKFQAALCPTHQRAVAG